MKTHPSTSRHKDSAAPPSRKARKHARHLLKHGRKWLWIQRDLLSDQQSKSCGVALDRLQSTLESQTWSTLAAAEADVDKQFETVKPRSQFSAWRENFEAIFVALVIAGAVRTYFIQPFKIPTGSMQPTLYGIHQENGRQVGGDRIFVDRFTYNFIRPSRGDVVVFRTRGLPQDYQRVGADFYIKRLVGLGGETIQIKNHRLHINGDDAPVTQPPIFEKIYTSEAYSGYLPVNETGTGYSRDQVRLYSDASRYPIPDDCYFVLGDNARNSTDSRYWGEFPRQDLIGRAFLVYWPLSPRTGLIH